jgi:hypothetical protein
LVKPDHGGGGSVCGLVAPPLHRPRQEVESEMLWTIIAILLLLWIFGLVLDVVGGIIHILLVIAVIAVLFQLLSGRRVV